MANEFKVRKGLIVSGSTEFGSSLTNLHQMTGSVKITGSLQLNNYSLPENDGIANQIIVSDGVGGLSFEYLRTVYEQVKNISGATLLKGTPVHVSSSVGNVNEVIAASASNAATMPATLILSEDLADQAEGLGIAFGFINGVDTSPFDEGDVVYVGTDGGYTNIKPSGSNLIQNLGLVTKVHPSNGSGLILGSGRTNDVPNLLSGEIFYGEDDKAINRSLSDLLTGSNFQFNGTFTGSIDYSNINNTPSGIISSSNQISDYNIYAELVGDSLISSSNQIINLPTESISNFDTAVSQSAVNFGFSGGGGGGLSESDKSTNYTIQSSDSNTRLMVSNNSTLSLPTGSIVTDGEVIEIKDISGNYCILEVSDGVTIDGNVGPYEIIIWKYSKITLYHNGTNNYTMVSDGEVDVLNEDFIMYWNTENSGTSSSNQITIPLISGAEYDCIIDWGDGSSTTQTNSTSPTHTYTNAGKYIVRISGIFGGLRFNNGGDKLKLLNIFNWGCFHIKLNTSNVFEGCQNLKINSDDVFTYTGNTLEKWFRNCFILDKISNGYIPKIITVTNMNSMFMNCYNFNMNLSGLNTSNITNMVNLFYDTSFNQNINGWDVSSVTDMSSMFYNSSFNQDINGWDVSSVNNMSSMFYNSSFNQDIGGWNVSSVTNMSSMFSNSSFNQDIGSWDVSNVTNMNNMFSNTSFNQDIGGWDVGNVTNMNVMFAFSSFNQDINGWDVSSVTQFIEMFNQNTSFNQDIGGWNVSSATNMTSMLAGATAFSTANYDLLLIGWSALTLQLNVTFSAGTTQYSAGAAAAARGVLTGTYSWTITDGGQV